MSRFFFFAKTLYLCAIGGWLGYAATNKKRKTMKRVLSLFILLLTLAAVSCGEKPIPEPMPEPTPDNPTPDDPAPEAPISYYKVAEGQCELGSVILSNYGEYLCIAASPNGGVEEFDAIFSESEYLYVAISPLLVGKEFDIKSEKTLFTIISTLGAAPLAELTPEQHSEVKSGRCRFDYEAGIATVTLDVTLADDRRLSAVLIAEKQIVVNRNTITRNGEDKPVRAAFHTEDDGKTYLYFTPAGVDYFDDMVESATWYIYLAVDNALLDAGNVDIATNEKWFQLGLGDNVDESKSLTISPDMLNGAVGYFSVERGEGERAFKVILDVQWGDGTMLMSYDGDCLDATAEEVRNNSIVSDGVEYFISGATIDRSDAEVWRLTLKSKQATLVLQMPAERFDGTPSGFSSDARILAEFNGETLSKAAGYSGTLIITFDEATMNIEAEFFNNSVVEAYYCGAVREA